MTDSDSTYDRNMGRALPILGGLLVGLAASLPLALAWPEAMRPPVGICLFGTEANPAERIWLDGLILPLPCMPTFLFMRPPVWFSFLGAGVVFGLIAHRLAGSGSRGLLAAVGGVLFLGLSYLGVLFVPRMPSLELPGFLSSGVAEPFALMIFAISLLFALAFGLALHTSGWFWRALLAATLTALCYWFVMWFLLGRGVMLWSHDPTTPPFAHSLPDLGNGMGAMMKTTLISNLIAGTVGGWGTLLLLTGRQLISRGVHVQSSPVSMSD